MRTREEKRHAWKIRKSDPVINASEIFKEYPGSWKIRRQVIN